MNRIRDLGLAVGSFVLMSVLFQVWFQNWTVVAIFMAAIALHELGHILALAVFGYKTRLVFIPFMGAATIPIDQKAFKQMKWFKSGVTYLSGPWVNFLLMVVALGVYVLSNDEVVSRYAMIAVGVNATLGVMNLWPVGGLDGGGFAKSLFESLHEADEKAFIRAVRYALIAGVLILLVSGRLPAFFTVIVVFWTIGIAANQDNPWNAYSHLAMSKKQAWQLTGWYCLMMVGMTIVSTVAPNWITLAKIEMWPFYAILAIVVVGQILLTGVRIWLRNRN